MTSEKTGYWIETLACRLVDHAARRAPQPLSERLAEEWLADLSERPRGFSRLRFALGCCWATSIIARERGVAVVSAVSAGAAPVNFGGYMQIAPEYSSRRTATFVLVASLHAAVLGGLMLGLTATYKKLTPPDPFRTVIIDKTRPPIDLPTVRMPNIAKAVVELPPVREFPPIDFERNATPVDSQTPAPISVEEHATSQQAAPHVVNRVEGSPGIGFPSTAGYYPDIAIRKGEQGAATVSACVDTRGRLTADPKIGKSTGSVALDEGALRLARAGSGHYQATTEDGVPVSSCYSFVIRFILNNLRAH